MIENFRIRVFRVVAHYLSSAGLRRSSSFRSPQTPSRSRLSKTSLAYHCSIVEVAESCTDGNCRTRKSATVGSCRKEQSSHSATRGSNRTHRVLDGSKDEPLADAEQGTCARQLGLTTCDADRVIATDTKVAASG
jgi:hypothetical protein